MRLVMLFVIILVGFPLWADEHPVISANGFKCYRVTKQVICMGNFLHFPTAQSYVVRGDEAVFFDVTLDVDGHSRGYAYDSETGCVVVTEDKLQNNTYANIAIYSKDGKQHSYKNEDVAKVLNQHCK